MLNTMPLEQLVARTKLSTSEYKKEKKKKREASLALAKETRFLKATTVADS